MSLSLRELAEILFVKTLDDGTNAFKNENSFKIRVISKPTRFSGPQTSSDDTETTATENGRVVETKFIFMGRILQNNMAHESYLPDICDLSVASDPYKQNVLGSLHTRIIASTKISPDVGNLQIGDEIVGECRASDVGDFDLQTIELSRISRIFEKSSQGGVAASCQSLKDAFDTSPVFSLAELRNGENPGNTENTQSLYDYWKSQYPNAANLFPPEGYCGTTAFPGYDPMPCKTGKIGTENVTLHPVFWDKVKEVYDKVEAKGFGEKFSAGGGLRSVKTQMSLRITNSIKAGNYFTYEQLLTIRSGGGNFKPPAAPIPTKSPEQGSRHLFGLAIDFSGILGTDSATNSETYKYMLDLETDGFKNYRAEPWHWSIDGK